MDVSLKIRYQPKQGILGLANPSVVTDRSSHKHTHTPFNLQTSIFLSYLRILERFGIKTSRTPWSSTLLPTVFPQKLWSVLSEQWLQNWAFSFLSTTYSLMKKYSSPVMYFLSFSYVGQFWIMVWDDMCVTVEWIDSCSTVGNTRANILP